MTKDYEMSGLQSEVHEKVNELIQSAKWHISLYYQDQLIWSNKREEKLWIRILQRSVFKARATFKIKDLSLVLTLSAIANCTVDRVHVEAFRGKKLLYRRFEIFKPICMRSGDTITTAIKIDLISFKGGIE